MKTISQVKQLNADKGFFWFTPETMRFFNSKIESELIYEKYFITSERMETSLPKRYTVRKVNWETGNIKTICNFRAFKTLNEAKKYIKEQLING